MLIKTGRSLSACPHAFLRFFLLIHFAANFCHRSLQLLGLLVLEILHVIQRGDRGESELLARGGVNSTVNLVAILFST